MLRKYKILLFFGNGKEKEKKKGRQFYSFHLSLIFEEFHGMKTLNGHGLCFHLNFNIVMKFSMKHFNAENALKEENENEKNASATKWSQEKEKKKNRTKQS